MKVVLCRPAEGGSAKAARGSGTTRYDAKYPRQFWQEKTRAFVRAALALQFAYASTSLYYRCAVRHSPDDPRCTPESLCVDRKIAPH